MVATFEYRAAQSVEEAVELLQRHREDAKILAGGQSLLPLVNLGLAQPGLIVDINRVPGLDRIERRDGQLVIGALTRHAMTEHSDVVRQVCPLLAETMPLIGDRQVRNRGTFGGSIAHADPVAELPTLATCLDASMTVQGPNGRRTIPARDFFVSYLESSMQPGEVLVEVELPILPEGTGYAFQELVRRKGDFAIVAAAATVQLHTDGTFGQVQLALAGVSDTPVRAAGASSFLFGKPVTPEVIREAAAVAVRGLEPESDVLASGEYRHAMAEVYARRTLEQAVSRARARR